MSLFWCLYLVWSGTGSAGGFGVQVQSANNHPATNVEYQCPPTCDHSHNSHSHTGTGPQHDTLHTSSPNSCPELPANCCFLVTTLGCAKQFISASLELLLKPSFARSQSSRLSQGRWWRVWEFGLELNRPTRAGAAAFLPVLEKMN